MSDDKRKPSYWETITAIGMLLGGAAALITALYTMNIIGHEDPEKMLAKSVPGVEQGDFVFVPKALLEQKEFPVVAQAEKRERNDFAKRGERNAGSSNKKTAEEFLEKNKDKKGVITRDSGLQYKIIKKGKGDKPTLTDTVKVHYQWFGK